MNNSSLLSKQPVHKTTRRIFNITYKISSGEERPRVYLITHRVIKFKYFFFPTFWIEHSNFIASCPHHPFLTIFLFSLVQGSHRHGNPNTRFRRHFQHDVARILAPKHYTRKNAELLITWLRSYEALVDCTMLPTKNTFPDFSLNPTVSVR